MFDTITLVVGGCIGSIITAGSHVIYTYVSTKLNAAEAKVPVLSAAVNGVANTVISDVQSVQTVEQLVTAAASHVSGLKSTINALNSAAKSL